MLEKVLHEKIGRVEPNEAVEQRIEGSVFLSLLKSRFSHIPVHVVDQYRDIYSLLCGYLLRHADEVFLQENLPVEVSVTATHQLEDQYSDQNQNHEIEKIQEKY